ncbi:hypothetical protein LguiB_006956 [Lonicera macranthoides]
MAAAARVMMVSSASNVTTTSSLLFKSPFLRPHTLTPSFNSRLLLSKKRFFNCRALYKPSIQTKEEGLPETLDYRVFFLDNSGKKIRKAQFSAGVLGIEFATLGILNIDVLLSVLSFWLYLFLFDCQRIAGIS